MEGRYSWTENDWEVEVTVPVPAATRKEEVLFKASPTTLRLALAGPNATAPPLLAVSRIDCGMGFELVVVDEFCWNGRSFSTHTTGHAQGPHHHGRDLLEPRYVYKCGIQKRIVASDSNRIEYKNSRPRQPCMRRADLRSRCVYTYELPTH